MKSGFVLLSRDAQLISAALDAAATVGIELRLLEEYPVISAAEFLISDIKVLIDYPALRPDLLVSTELTDSIWRYAATYAPAQLVQLPQAASWFQTWLTNQHLIKSPLICIRSVTAGAGSSVLATAISYTAAQQHEVVLVDLDHRRSALNLLTTIETKNAVSWEQLSSLVGLPAGSAMSARLPSHEKLKLLSFNSNFTKPPEIELVENVIALMREQFSLVVVDLGHLSTSILHRTTLTKSILVSPCNLLGVSKLKTQLAANQVVLRFDQKTGLTKTDALDFLGVSYLPSYKSDPKLQLDIADGVIPGERKKSELRKISEELLIGLKNESTIA